MIDFSIVARQSWLPSEGAMVQTGGVLRMFPRQQGLRVQLGST